MATLFLKVLSYSVASVLSLLFSGLLMQGFGNDAYFTAEFVGTIDTLFDSINSKVSYSNKPHKGAVKADSGHLELWESMIPCIESWEFRDNRGGKSLLQARRGG